MLSFLLLLPLGLVLAGIYWWAAGRRGQDAAQRRHDRAALALTLLATLTVSVLAARFAPDARGAIWAEVHSALWGFFTLLAVLAAAWGLRPQR